MWEPDKAQIALTKSPLAFHALEADSDSQAEANNNTGALREVNVPAFLPRCSPSTYTYKRQTAYLLQPGIA
jgi:hypothetical protein